MEHLEVSAAQVIKEVTNTKFQIPKGMEEVNMCEAIEVLMKRRETEGITQGKLSLLKELVDDGTLTMEAAAGKVNMSVEEFKEYTKKELSIRIFRGLLHYSVSVPAIYDFLLKENSLEL